MVAATEKQSLRLRQLHTARAVAQARPFVIPQCAQCKARLADSKGNPRWDLLEGRFLCWGGCAPMRPARLARKAGRS